jgi:hypothetical protein
MNYTIKISGGGTVAEIIDSLKEIIDSIEIEDTRGLLDDDGLKYEDPTLYAEMSEDEEEDEGDDMTFNDPLQEAINDQNINNLLT